MTATASAAFAPVETPSGPQDEAPQAGVRRRQYVDELFVAAIRALAGERRVAWRGRRLYLGDAPLVLRAPHLAPDAERDDFASFRGAADGIALRLRHSDAALHARLTPEGAVERWVFELLEQYRVESLATLPGVRENLRHRYRQWLLSWQGTGHAESVAGLLLYTVAQVVRERVCGEPPPAGADELTESTRAKLGPVLGGALRGLRLEREDQARYAQHALAIAAAVAAMLRSAVAALEDDSERGGRAGLDRLLSTIWIEDDGSDGAAAAPGAAGALRDEVAEGYRVYTTAYDREVAAVSLLRPGLARELRARLDARIAGQGVNVPRLAAALQALLAPPARDGWDSALEEGRVDGRRLASLVASPTERRLFREDRIAPGPGCLVGLLIDCSGSMKQHAGAVAALADILVRALDAAGVASEVLGFTTGAWDGGRARRDWNRAGRPPRPGRLNEACHLVFKEAEDSWRGARLGLAALLKSDLFREGIDGEAVDWACGRLEACDAQRRVLVVVSDGCPMDTATAQANGADYLDLHLREVVARRARRGSVEIRGLGVGLDLRPYYPTSRVIELGERLRNQVFREILELLAPRVPRFGR
jgi:cobaltochelatase CobT